MSFILLSYMMERVIIVSIYLFKKDDFDWYFTVFYISILFIGDFRFKLQWYSSSNSNTYNCVWLLISFTVINIIKLIGYNLHCRYTYHIGSDPINFVIIIKNIPRLKSLNI